MKKRIAFALAGILVCVGAAIYCIKKRFRIELICTQNSGHMKN